MKNDTNRTWKQITSLKEFQEIKKGDVLKVNEIKELLIATGDAFYNADCDEPDWEVETNNNFISYENDIWIQCEHEAIFSSGLYLNYTGCYTDKYDLFIICNEPNSTEDIDYEKIDDFMTVYLRTHKEIDTKYLENELEEFIPYGCQVILK